MECQKAIGVFDSGVGGITVLARATQALPYENFIYYADAKNFPYGDNDPEIIKKGVDDAMKVMVAKGIKAMVIACNTATSVTIQHLREVYDFPILGIEPALKGAVTEAKNHRVAVIATALTLKQAKFQKLLKDCDAADDIVKLPAPGLADMIEAGHYDDNMARAFLKKLFHDVGHLDSIVLGCTHYLFLLPLIKEFYPNATIMDGGEGTARHLCHILEEKKILAPNGNGKIEVLSSDDTLFQPKFQRFYQDIQKIISAIE